MRARLTKRDAAVLGVFLVVVVSVCVVLVKRQVSSTVTDGGDAVVLASASPDAETGTALVPTSGLPLGFGLIADPQAFRQQPGQATGPGARGGVTFGPRSTSAAASAGSHASGNASAPSGSGGRSGSSRGPSGPDGAGGPSGGGVVTVYIAALAGRGESLSALMVQRDTGNTRWVPVGGSAFGYTLDYATLKGVVLSRDGRQYVLELGEGRGEAAPTAEAPKAAAPKVTETAAAPADKTDAQRLLGTWSGSMQGMTISMTFIAGGSGTMKVGGMPQGMSFTWSVLSPGKLQFSMSIGGGPSNSQTASYRFEGDNTLYMTGPGGPEMRLTR